VKMQDESMKIALGVFLGVALALIGINFLGNNMGSLVSSGYCPMMGGYGMMGGGRMGGGALAGGIFSLFFWILIIGAVIYGIQNIGRKESALDLLDKRYALGEISEKEYGKARKKLEEKDI